MSDTDFSGRPIQSDEPSDAIIDVWEVTPHPQSCRCDFLIERSWQKMLGLIGDNLDSFLERFDDDELREGVSIKIKLTEMAKCDYEEIISNED